MFRSAASPAAKPRSRAAALAAVCAALLAATATLPLVAHAQGLTEKQMIEQLLGKTSRGAGQQPAAKSLSPAETNRLRALLDKAGTRAFSAKERTEVAEARAQIAEAVRERPSLDFEIYFPFNSSSVQKSAVPTLQKIGQILTNEAFKDRGFLIAGHTDAKGRPEPNQVVSQRRAESVKAYLVKNYGIDPARLRVIGYGKEQLKDASQPFASINRRVQIINLPDGTLTASR
jgi:outer membrane protein OmpA-like peptidoglycan-associated protein